MHTFGGLSYCSSQCNKIAPVAHSQRENMVCYKLDKNIQTDKLIQDITRLIGSEKNLENKVLIIKIENIINYQADSLLLKLPHHE